MSSLQEANEVVYDPRFDDELYHEDLSYMSWLAVPLTEQETQMRIWKSLKCLQCPALIKEIEEQEAVARKEQFLRSLLVSRSLDFVITNDDQKVPVSELEGKIVGLYVWSLERPLFDFTPSLVEVYKILKERGENFEIVFVCLENEDDYHKLKYDSLYKQDFESMPLYALPFQDRRCNKLARYFGPKPSIKYHYPALPPILVIIGIDGKILNQSAAEVVAEHGVEAYPFTLERLEELEEVEKEKQETQTLKSLLVSGDRDFLLGNGDTKVPMSDLSWNKKVHVSDLMGKTILLVFLERWCGIIDFIVQELTEWVLYTNAFRVVNGPQAIGTMSTVVVGHIIARSVILFASPMCFGEEFKDVAKEDKSDTTDQSLRSALLSCSCDFLMSYNQKMVPISELERKFVGLCFFSSSYKTYKKYDLYCEVINLYEYLKKKEVNLEIVLVPLDVTYYDFKKHFGGTQWFTVPYKGKCREKLACYFNIPPKTVQMVFGPDGKIVNSNAVSVIENYGYNNVFPFTSKRYAELVGMVRARVEACTLESVFISWEKDFVINKDGAKILESIGVIKQCSRVPWLGFPCGDRRINLAQLAFQIEHRDFPAVIALGPTGNLITRKAKDVILLYGDGAYPFTDEHILKVETQTEEMEMDWPRKVKHPLHVNYDLVLQNIKLYNCRKCDFGGVLWTCCCQGCNYKYHPNCAIGEDIGAQKFELPCKNYMYGPGNGRPCIMD
ncbi:hypothetical protein SO802_011791 [Lithocarpus litseifolius]|uniref:protein-disulfide reductase n=1 Tax=Lithocarpus litseifolius TaxID=425828 RepID=A0AAW2D107_9ROSI